MTSDFISPRYSDPRAPGGPRIIGDGRGTLRACIWTVLRSLSHSPSDNEVVALIHTFGFAYDDYEITSELAACRRAAPEDASEVAGLLALVGGAA